MSRTIIRRGTIVQAMPITLSPELEAKLQARAAAAGLTIETYIERAVDDDYAAEAELEALALEGLNSGEAMEAEERFWAEKRQRLMERHATSNAK